MRPTSASAHRIIFRRWGFRSCRDATLANTTTAIRCRSRSSTRRRRRACFPGKNPIGQYLTNFGPKEDKLQIVGVIGNVRHVALGEGGAAGDLYVPITQTQWPSMFFAVRSAVSNPLTLLPAVQSAVWSVDRNVPLAHPRTMQDVLAHSVLRRKFAMLLALDFRRPRHVARRHRPLRRDLVFCRPANEGNRHPHGAGRTARGHAADGLAAKRKPGVDRHAHRRAGRAWCNAFVRRDALRRRRDRFR